MLKSAPTQALGNHQIIDGSSLSLWRVCASCVINRAALPMFRCDVLRWTLAWKKAVLCLLLFTVCERDSTLWQSSLTGVLTHKIACARLRRFNLQEEVLPSRDGLRISYVADMSILLETIMFFGSLRLCMRWASKVPRRLSQTNLKYFECFSLITSAADANYAIGSLTSDASSDLLNASSWVKIAVCLSRD